MKLKFIGKVRETYVRAHKTDINLTVIPGEIVDVPKRIGRLLAENPYFELLKNPDKKVNNEVKIKPDLNKPESKDGSEE